MFPGAGGSTSNDRYYQVLGVDKKASPDVIKKAYRTLALKYHPDKNPDAGDQFRAVNQAHEILSDPQKKKIYDKFGERGISMMESGVFGEDGKSTFLPMLLSSPTFMVALLTLFLGLVVTALLFPILLARNLDNPCDYGYKQTFIPLWVFFGVVLLLHPLLFAFPWLQRLVSWLRVASVTAFFVMLMLYLENARQFTLGEPCGAMPFVATKISEWTLFVPLFVQEVLAVAWIVLTYPMSSAKLGEARQAGFLQYSLFGFGFGGYLVRMFAHVGFRTIFYVLCALMLEGKFKPLLLMIYIAAWSLYVVVVRSRDAYIRADAQARANPESDLPPPGSAAWGNACAGLCAMAFSLTLYGLLLGKMQDPLLSRTWVVSFTPLWIVSGVIACAFCVFCFFGSCAACAGEEEELDHPWEDDAEAPIMAQTVDDHSDTPRESATGEPTPVAPTHDDGDSQTRSKRVKKASRSSRKKKALENDVDDEPEPVVPPTKNDDVDSVEELD